MHPHAMLLYGQEQCGCCPATVQISTLNHYKNPFLRQRGIASCLLPVSLYSLYPPFSLHFVCSFLGNYRAPSRTFSISLHSTYNHQCLIASLDVAHIQHETKMEKLLQWSIATQSGDHEAANKIGQPDQKTLQQLFGGGGPDEPTLMKQSIVVVENPEADLEAKEVALENFEMLVENLDNANNIGNMKLWPNIINQLKGQEPSLQVLAASIIGVATQNNPQSQQAFLEQPDGLDELCKNSESSNRELALKCLFALSCLLRNFPEATAKFAQLGGWNSLTLDNTPDHKLLLRKLSLVSALLSTGLDEEKLKQVHDCKVVPHLISTLTSDNLACTDKVLNIITQLQELKYQFSKDEVSQLAEKLDAIEHKKDSLSQDDFNRAKQVAF